MNGLRNSIAKLRTDFEESNTGPLLSMAKDRPLTTRFGKGAT
jgi:hypothetical protein